MKSLLSYFETSDIMLESVNNLFEHDTIAKKKYSGQVWQIL